MILTENPKNKGVFSGKTPKEKAMKFLKIMENSASMLLIMN